MAVESELDEERWVEVSKSSLTRTIYQKKYRIETPDGGEKLVETEDELEHYLSLFYGET